MSIKGKEDPLEKLYAYMAKKDAREKELAQEKAKGLIEEQEIRKAAAASITKIESDLKVAEDVVTKADKALADAKAKRDEVRKALRMAGGVIEGKTPRERAEGAGAKKVIVENIIKDAGTISQKDLKQAYYEQTGPVQSGYIPIVLGQLEDAGKISKKGGDITWTG